MILSCSSNVPYYFSVPVNTNTTFVPPNTSFGDCTLTVDPSSLLFVSSSSSSIIIEYQLSFLNAPAVIYVNQPFNITIQSSGVPPSNLTSNLYLNCGGSSAAATWPSVPLNTLTSLTVPNSVSVNSGCAFETDSSPNFSQATSPVSVQFVSLQFSLPQAQSSLTQVTNIPILLVAVDWPYLNQLVNASIVCADVSFSQLIEVTTNVQFDFPPNFSCRLVCHFSPIGS